MRNFLNLKTLSENVRNMKQLADAVHDIYDDSDVESKLANLIEEWDFTMSSELYFQSTSDVTDNKFLYLLHMRHGTTFVPVLNIDGVYMPFPQIEKWSDLLLPHVRLAMTILAQGSISDVKLRVGNWSPIDEPRLKFSMIMDFIHRVEVLEIIGIVIDTKEYKYILKLLESYTLFLERVSLDPLTFSVG